MLTKHAHSNTQNMVLYYASSLGLDTAVHIAILVLAYTQEYTELSLDDGVLDVIILFVGRFLLHLIAMHMARKCYTNSWKSRSTFKRVNSRNKFAFLAWDALVANYLVAKGLARLVNSVTHEMDMDSLLFGLVVGVSLVTNVIHAYALLDYVNSLYSKAQRARKLLKRTLRGANTSLVAQTSSHEANVPLLVNLETFKDPSLVLRCEEACEVSEHDSDDFSSSDDEQGSENYREIERKRYGKLVCV